MKVVWPRMVETRGGEHCSEIGHILKVRPIHYAIRLNVVI